MSDPSEPRTEHPTRAPRQQVLAAHRCRHPAKRVAQVRPSPKGADVDAAHRSAPSALLVTGAHQDGVGEKRYL